jgi:hypothetical protein
VRTLTAVVTALAFLVIGASVSAACDGMKRDQTAAGTGGAAYYPPAESS